MVKMEVLVPHKEKSYSAECSATHVANLNTAFLHGAYQLQSNCIIKT